MDPFPPTCDPAAYVPRPATERVLEALQAAFRAARPVIALSGPGGLGKTMVLRVLETRLAQQAHCLHLPYAALTSEDLVAWVLGLVGHETTTEAPEAALRELAIAGLPLVLLLDDASALPPETARDLVHWARSFAGALRLVVVPVDDGRAGRVLAALGDDVLDLRLHEPMSEFESVRYLAARLDRLPDPGKMLAKLSPERIAWLYRESCGNPRVLHGLVAWLLYSDGPAPGTYTTKLEHWLDTDPGSELDELEAAEEDAPDLDEKPATPVREACGEGELENPPEAAHARRRRRRRR